MFNGIEDFEIESTGGIFGRIVLGAMLIVFALASMVTTFGFFTTYAPGLGAVIHPEYGRYIAGALGVLLFDLAGLGWTVLRSQNSDTTKQFTIASIAAVVTISLALLVSGLQVILSSSFDIGLFTADGGLSDFGQIMQLTGVIVMTLGFCLNFAAIAAYVNMSKGVTQSTQNTQLRAYVTAGRFAADRARAELVTRQTLEGVFRQLPDQAAQAGRQNTADYLNRSFNNSTPYPNGTPVKVEQVGAAGPEEKLQVYRRLPGPDQTTVPEVIGEFDTLAAVNDYVAEQAQKEAVPEGTIFKVFKGKRAVDTLRVKYLDDDEIMNIINDDELNSLIEPGKTKELTIQERAKAIKALSRLGLMDINGPIAQEVLRKSEETPFPLPARPSTNGRHE